MLRVRDQATTALQRLDQRIGDIDKRFKHLEASSTTGGEKLTAAFKGLGAVLAGVSFAAIGREVVQAGTDFERASGLIAGLGSEMRESIGEIQEASRQLAVQYGAALGDVAAAQFDYLSATQDVAGQTQAVGEALKIATAGGTSAAVAMDALTSIMGNFSLSGERAAEISESLFRSQQRGKVTMEQLASSIGNVASSARAAGASYQEMLGALAAVTSGGLGGDKTAVGATSIARFFDAVSVASPKVVADSREMAKAAGVVGFEFSKAQLQADGLAVFLEKLSRVTGGDALALNRLGIATEAAKGTQILLKDSARATTAALDDQKRAAHELDTAVGVMQDTVANRLDRLSALWTEAKVGLFDEFLGPAKGGFDELIPSIDAVRTGVALIGQVGRAAIALLSQPFDALQAALAGLIDGVTAAVEALAGLGESLGVVSEETLRSIQSFRATTREEFTKERLDLVDNWNTYWGSLGDAFDTLKGKVEKGIDFSKAKPSESLGAAEATGLDVASLRSAAPDLLDRGAYNVVVDTFGTAGDAAARAFHQRLADASREVWADEVRSRLSPQLAEVFDVEQKWARLREEILAQDSLTEEQRTAVLAQFQRVRDQEIGNLVKRQNAENLKRDKDSKDEFLETQAEFNEESVRRAQDAALELSLIGKSQTQQALARLAVERDERIAAAKKVGGDVVAIEREYADRRQAIIEQAAADAADAEIRAAGQRRAALREAVLSGQDLGLGFQLAVDDIGKASERVGELGYGIGQDLNRAFGDVAVAGLTRLGDASESAAERMRRAFSNAFDQIASDAIRFGVGSIFASIFPSKATANPGVGATDAANNLFVGTGAHTPGGPEFISGSFTPGGVNKAADLGAGPSKSAAAVTVVYAPSISAVDGPSVRQLLHRERDTIVGELVNAIDSDQRVRHKLRNLR